MNEADEIIRSLRIKSLRTKPSNSEEIKDCISYMDALFKCEWVGNTLSEFLARTAYVFMERGQLFKFGLRVVWIAIKGRL